MAAADSLLLIVGASARAAAFSAVRAGFRPVCADLFADRDLQDCCPVIRIPASSYPQGFRKLDLLNVPGPWMYTGGLENHPCLVAQISRFRTLWGNPGDVLRKVRCPFEVARILAAADLPCPAVKKSKTLLRSDIPWLRKPLRGAGGRGIRFEEGQAGPSSSPHDFYWQEFIPGPSLAAVFLADGKKALVVGVTQQLVGASWLHAAPFQYCGSIGPLLLEPCLQESFTRLGTALVSGCGLRGLFGVDTILRDGLPWLVEVNPRYTASVEVLELALGVALLGGHKKAFEPTNPFSADKDYRFPKSLIPIGPNKKKPGWGGKLQGSMVGKAILFAPCSFVFPGTASWAYQQGPNPFLQQTVALADIPVPGTKIKARQPVFTFFFRAHSVTSCLDGLKEIAADLDRRLFGAYKREDSG